MARRLAWLKLRLLVNGLRADRQRRIGFPLSVVLLGWVSLNLAGDYRATMAGLTGAARGEVALWAGLGLFAVWVALPVVIFPLDETLDPARFALLPVRRHQLLTGLAMASLIAPSVVIPLTLLGANLSVFFSVLPAAIVSGVLMLALMIVAGQLFTTTLSAVFRSRRGRDLSVLIIASIGLVGFGSQQLLRAAIERLGISGAAIAYPVSSAAWLLPPVAAQRIVTEAAAGRPLGSLIFTVVTAVWILALAWVWGRLLDWLLTTPTESPSMARTRRGLGLAGRFGWSPVLVMARKELRFYLRDPRLRLVWTGAAIFVGLAAASILVGVNTLPDLRARTWLPLAAPGLVLFVGLPIALNVFGWERNAASFLFVLPVRGRRMLAGKNLATALALAAETAVISLILAGVTGRWEMLRFMPALTVCAVGCQLAVGNLVSVLTPLRLPREGTDLFAQATEQGCLAVGAQLVSFFTIGLLLVLPASVLVLTVGFGGVVSEWFAHLVTVVWGIGFYSLSLWLAGRLLDRRLPEVAGWVQVV